MRSRIPTRTSRSRPTGGGRSELSLGDRDDTFRLRALGVKRSAPTATALSLALLLVAGLVGPVASAEGASYRRCGVIRDLGPTGRDPADAAGILAAKVTCLTARRVARAWFRRRGEPVRIGVFLCRSAIGSRQRVRCLASGGRAVRFYLG